MTGPAASSSTDGFFQTSPKLPNQFEDDDTFRRIAEFYLPVQILEAVKTDLSRFGSLVVTSEVLSWVTDAEKNLPYLNTWDAWGHRIDTLITSEGWRKLQALGIAEGIVATGYEREYAEASRVVQFLKYHLWTGSAANVTCPSAMTDGAAKLILLEISRMDNDSNLKSIDRVKREVLKAAFKRLTSRDPDMAWTSGQWMTERSGGSDVQNTETIAHLAAYKAGDPTTDGLKQPLGPWKIDGFKWFSSATDASMTVLLARTSTGISLFYAPMHCLDPPSSQSTNLSSHKKLNGVQIQRLKQKLGTKPLPTAELVLQNMRGWLLGEEGKGTKAISTVLNITRIHNAVSAVGYWGRCLAISRAFAYVRRTSGKLLRDTPLHVATLAKMHVEYSANMHLVFFTVAILGLSEQTTASGTSKAPIFTQHPVAKDTSSNLLRLLTPITKALTAKACIAGIQECMESLGGVGYLDHEDMSCNIARIYRDANVLSIWEGTTDVLAEDVVRVLKGRNAEAVFTAFENWALASISNLEGLSKNILSIQRVQATLLTLKKQIIESSVEELKFRGRELSKQLGWVICAILLLDEARWRGDSLSAEVARRYILGIDKSESWTKTAQMDQELVFGKSPLNMSKL